MTVVKEEKIITQMPSQQCKYEEYVNREALRPMVPPKKTPNKAQNTRRVAAPVAVSKFSI